MESVLLRGFSYAPKYKGHSSIRAYCRKKTRQRADDTRRVSSAHRMSYSASSERSIQAVFS